MKAKPKKSKVTVRSMGGLHLKARDAEIIASFIERTFPDGAVTAHGLLDAARSRNSPIHRFFDWNDSSAAEKYRLSQARMLIRCVVVEVDGVETRKYVPPVYVDGKHRAYVEIEMARHDESIWEQVLERALKEAILWKLKYGHLKELTIVTDAIRRVEAKYGKG